jgi:hypothetical protein
MATEFIPSSNCLIPCLSQPRLEAMELPQQSLLFTPRSAVHSPGAAFEDGSALRPPRTGGPVSTPGVRSSSPCLRLCTDAHASTARPGSRYLSHQSSRSGVRAAVSLPRASSESGWHLASNTLALCRACPVATGAPARAQHRPPGHSSTWCVHALPERRCSRRRH